MKKLLGIVVLGLLLSSCAISTAGKRSVTSVIKEGSDKDFVCENYIDGKEFLTTHGLCFTGLAKNYEYDEVNKTELIWNGVSKVFFVFENVNTPMKCKYFNLKSLSGCDRGDGTLRKITFSINEAKDWMNNDFAKAEKEKEIKKKKKKILSASNNTLNRSFVCSYKFNPSEKSKIKIRGSTATETTAIGISINYSIVNLSSKGAFSLQGSSKQDRAWFIGAKSFLLLGVDAIPYNCN
tara:strand:- start:103 stop:813 length:711 start_codon:yes stop_codon:yes gene_type:complete